MKYSFSQQKDIYKLSFYTKIKYIPMIEEYFYDNSLAISTQEIEPKENKFSEADIWLAEIYLNNQPDQKYLNIIKSYFEKLEISLLGEFIIEKTENKDWVKEYNSTLSSMVIGQFYVTPKTLVNNCPEGKTYIIIEPSSAFGTGHHATTQLCIEAMQVIDGVFHNILDIGTGSGILSFVAEKLWPKSFVSAHDIDPEAVRSAKNNAINNNSMIAIKLSEVNKLDIEDGTKFNLIISNILLEPLINNVNLIRNFSKNGTIVVLSGFLESQYMRLLAIYEREKFKLLNISRKEEWICLTMEYYE